MRRPHLEAYGQWGLGFQTFPHNDVGLVALTAEADVNAASAATATANLRRLLMSRLTLYVCGNLSLLLGE
jgi:hypothetical protein